MWDSAPRAKLSCGLISSSESLLGEDGGLRLGLQEEKGKWTSSTLQPHAVLSLQGHLGQGLCKAGFPQSQLCPMKLSLTNEEDLWEAEAQGSKVLSYQLSRSSSAAEAGEPCASRLIASATVARTIPSAP